MAGLVRLRLVAAVCATVVLSACAVGSLSFRKDDRLQFVQPDDRSLVSVPLDVHWTFHGEVASFAVFVDRAPIPPGATMRAVANRDDLCLRDRTCPDKHYLETRQVYGTTAPSVTIRQVYPIEGLREPIQLHTLTVVLMDSSGRRIGESAWSLRSASGSAGYDAEPRRASIA